MVDTKLRSYDPKELELFEIDKMSQPMFENENDGVLTSLKETESAWESPEARQERNTVRETKNPEGNKSDCESIVNEETSVQEMKTEQNIDNDRESESES